MFNVGDWLYYIPDESHVEVESVNCDFITVVDSTGECHVVMPEDYDKYKVSL